MARDTGIAVFDFEIEVHVCTDCGLTEPLHGGCLSDGEVDVEIGLLKENLDRVAVRMKRAIREQRAHHSLGTSLAASRLTTVGGVRLAPVPP